MSEVTKETTYEFKPKCPACGYEHVDAAWDFDWDVIEVAETWCHSCDAPISIYRRVSLSFDTKIRVEKPKVSPVPSDGAEAAK